MRHLYSKLTYLFVSIFYLLLVLGWVDLESFRDNERYFWVYSKFEGATIPESFLISFRNIGMWEPFSTLAFWVASNLQLNYYFFIFLADMIFLWFLRAGILKLGFNYLHVYLFVFLNFYVFRLCLDLHKFKLGITLFLMLTLLFRMRPFLALFFAIFGHIQLLIPAVSNLFVVLSSRIDLVRFKFDAKIFWYLLPLIFLIPVYPLVLKKVLYYFDFHAVDFFVSACFALLVWLISSRRAFLFCIPVLFAIFLFGNARLNLVLMASPLVYSEGRIKLFLLLYCFIMFSLWIQFFIKFVF